MKYTIYFELGNKKLKHTIEAYSREDAISRLKNKINVLRVDQEIDESIKEVERLKSIFGLN